MNLRRLVCSWACLGGALALAQQQSPPLITLEDALSRARQYGGQVQNAELVRRQTQEDTHQARAARLPSVNAFNQFIYTQPNGTPSGVFVANDGVHVYNEQAIIHQELLALARRGEVDRALAAEAVARARTEIAARGLTFTVIQDYYAIVAAMRRTVNLQRSLQEATRFHEITEKQEKGGEVAHADVVRARIDLQSRQRDAAESILAIQKAKIALGVLIFPGFSADFDVVDDLDQVRVLPPMPEAQAAAAESSPDVKAASAGVRQAGFDVKVARYAYVPSLALDFFYGINANEFAARTYYPDEPYRQNLGYAAQATLNIPLWNWGSTRSKVKQAEFRRDQAQLELNLSQRALQSNVAAAYAEAATAQAQLELLKSSFDLASESLRLTLLRYQSGEATALEVVDSQNTLTAARNNNDDGLVRRRVALANLLTLMGTF